MLKEIKRRNQVVYPRYMHCISYIIWLEVLFHTFAYSLTNLFKLRPEILKLKKKTNKKTNWKKKKKKALKVKSKDN